MSTVDPTAATPPATTTTPPATTPPASSGTGAGSSDTSTAIQGLNSNYQSFLTLLTTQLQNQDPTQPADTNQLTEEIASLSQVQQEINMNASLQQLISMFASSQTNDALTYIGKQVDAPGNQSVLSGGQAAFAYDLPAGTSSATVTITNAAGQTVYSAPGTTLQGRNQVLWNGTATDGSTAPDGTYNFTVTAKDSGGNPVTATTLTTGIVQSVDTENGAASLSLGNNLDLPLAQVQSVRTPGT